MVSNSPKVHILLAEDDSDDIMFFEEAINASSITAILVTVADGEKLMKVLSKVDSPPPPDVIFLDINMPKKNGKECLEEIRRKKIFDSVPVIMFSTSTSSSDIDETYKKGANLYIPKSFFFSDQKNILEKLFSEKWRDYLKKIPKEKFVLKKGTLKEIYQS